MKAIVTVLGEDKVGIIARVSNALSDLNVNVEDISQTIMQNYFTMIMMVSFNDDVTIEQIDKSLQEVAREKEVEINVRHEDIYKSMHRI